MFTFTLSHTSPHSRARRGSFVTPHGVIETPVFMPCGTKGTVKTMKPEELTDIGVQILLGNTYHLYLRPGMELLKKMGGLHKFMNWDRPILTDSGGFQVFSLGGGFTERVGQSGQDKKPAKSLVKITDEGVEFRSYLDGSKHFFTPEKVMEIEEAIGADIMMAFDECAPGKSDYTYAKAAMDRTHAWVLRSKKRHEELQKERAVPQALFPIVQGVTYDDLRVESAKFMSELDLPGVAIGGLAVGEPKEVMYHVLDVVEPHLPTNKPRYLMGVGTPEDLLEGVSRGVDMFDCVLPTRLGRHGTYFTKDGKMTISNQKFFEDTLPLEEGCGCYACSHYSRAYVRHLFTENEILGMHLMTYHNLWFLTKLMEDVRRTIEEGTFESFKTDFLRRYLA